MRCITFLLSFLFFLPPEAVGSHGASIDSQLKYSSDFVKFDYTSAKAKKGGRLILHEIGSFDTTNPFTLKGSAAFGIEELIYEPLAVQSMDEPFAMYGLLAKDIAIAPDRKSVIFTMNENARFSDGTPVKIDDVAYTIDTFTGDLVHPFYNSYYQDVAGYEKLDENRIRVLFKKGNRELPLIVAQMKILPRKAQAIFTDPNYQLTDSSRYPVGSGPYVISELIPGKSITYKRNSKYWAADHPTRSGQFNFDEILVKYYKDQVVALEAFKAGEFDFLSVNIAKQWARDLVGPKFNKGLLIKKTFPHKNIAGMQGFTMNMRRPLFKDVRVRKALGLCLNFEWINSALFYSQYKRNDSFFSNSLLAAEGLPEGLELEYLLPFRQELPAEVFTSPLVPPKVASNTDLRKNLIEARNLFSQAGWNIEDGVLKNQKGEIFTFDFLLSSQTFERVLSSFAQNLKKLGIIVHYRTIDPALYMSRIKAFDYDMIVTNFAQSQSPGNEQVSYWHSSSADRPGSRNYAGVHSPVVDKLVDRIVYASSSTELTAACRALDRVLWYDYFTIPNWYLPVHRLSYTKDFIQPEILPLYYDPFQFLMTWWKD